MRSEVVTIEPIGLTAGHAGWHLFTAVGVAAWAAAELGSAAPPVTGWHVPASADRPTPTTLCRTERQTLHADTACGTSWWPGVPTASSSSSPAGGAAADDATEVKEEVNEEVPMVVDDAAEAADAAEEEVVDDAAAEEELAVDEDEQALKDSIFTGPHDEGPDGDGADGADAAGGADEEPVEAPPTCRHRLQPMSA